MSNSNLKNPKFYLAILAVLIPAINTTFNLHIPVAEVISVSGVLATSILGFAHFEATQVKYPTPPTDNSLINELKYEVEKAHAVLASLGIKYQNGQVTIPVASLGGSIAQATSGQVVAPAPASAPVVAPAPVSQAPAVQSPAPFKN